MSNAKEVRPFGIRDKVGYMFGDLANDFSFIFASTYVMVFYTKIMGISTAMVGTMFLIARCIDAFTDIGMGRIVDSSKPTKNGRIRPWILRMDVRLRGTGIVPDVSVLPCKRALWSKGSLYVRHLHSLGIDFLHLDQHPLRLHGIGNFQ